MYKRILVPLDGSVLSESILEHVKIIATASNTPEVVLLRVFGPIEGGYEIPEPMLSEMQGKNQAMAEDYISKLTDNLKKEGIDATGVVICGRAPEEILDYVKDNQVDLVIMSTHGRSGISRWFIGSVTNRVVRRSVAPVMVASPSACR